MIAGQILGAHEKGDTKITVKVLGDGAMGPIIAVADSRGHVKGYVKNRELDYKKASTGEVLVAPFVGNGFLVVVKDMGLKQPYSGQVDLITGEIGEDLAWYFLSSEQTPSSVGVNVLLNEDSDTCLLYTSDAADEEDSVDLGGSRIIKKKKKKRREKKKTKK